MYIHTIQHSYVHKHAQVQIIQTHTIVLCRSQVTCWLPSHLSTMLSSKGISFLLPRHRGRSPEEGRKSRRTHSRRCSKNHYKVSPEARSSHLPSQPLQRLGFLSARGVVSIPHIPSVSLAMTLGGGGGPSSGQCTLPFNSILGKISHWLQISLLVNQMVVHQLLTALCLGTWETEEDKLKHLSSYFRGWGLLKHW